MPLPPAISTRGISKRFGRLVAVRDLSLEVNQDEIFGFLGLNGAGKTTTIRLLLDLLRPTAGRATVLGFDCRSQGLQVRARVGYMPGEIGLYGDMTGMQLLDFLARLGNQAVRLGHLRARRARAVGPTAVGPSGAGRPSKGAASRGDPDEVLRGGFSMNAGIALLRHSAGRYRSLVLGVGALLAYRVISRRDL